MSKMLKRFAKDESGATAIEYGLLASLIALAIIATVTTLGGSVSEVFGKLDTGIKPKG